jgi:hypothetical protein
MRIIAFEIIEHLALLVHFEDGAQLQVRFSGTGLRGASAALLDESEFATAHLAGDTVRWLCGFELDGQVARIRADEASVWRPATP